MSNDFLTIAGGGSANVLSQAAYAALTTLLADGYPNGAVLPAPQLNKHLRQSSIMAAVLSQFIVDISGANAVDDGSITTLLANLKTAVAKLASNSATITATVAANALTLAIGSTGVTFRDTSPASGTLVSLTSAGATLTVPSGATLGCINAVAARIAILAINNAGIIELAVSNLTGGFNLDETTLINTTALSAASDSSNIIYSTTARTGVAFRVLGFIDISETSAGTWASAPTLVQAAFGEALTSLASLGYSQTWQNFTSGQRALGVTYYNTIGKPIQVNASYYGGVASSSASSFASVNGVFVSKCYCDNNLGSDSNSHNHSFIVPPGGSYVVTITGSVSFLNWAELR